MRGERRQYELWMWEGEVVGKNYILSEHVRVNLKKTTKIEILFY